MSPRISLLCAAACLVVPALAQQASITLQNSDVAYCYKQDVSWNLTKTNDALVQPVASPTVVNWTITATKGTPGPKTLCAIGFVSVTNTGSAPATIGNIVVNVQRNTGKWTVLSADVADSFHGDAATQANMVAGALQGQTTYPPSIVTTTGAQATFHENSLSGTLEFTDADSNTIWAISPQKTIAVGATVNLFFTAKFNVDALSPALAPNEQLRTEAFVTFGNAGARGGSGATASNIDINGNGVIDSSESNVRSVPTRVTKAVPALQVCNNTVTITDAFGTDGTAAEVTTTDPIGAGIATSTSAVYTVTGTVSGSGTVTNTASLDGVGSTVTLTLGPPDPVTLVAPTATLDCCIAAHQDASSSVVVTDAGNGPPPPPSVTGCSYTQGGFQGGGVPGGYLTNNFATYFPSPAGMTIGTQPSFYAQWVGSAGLTALKTFLAGGGPSGKMTANTVNATSVSGGALSKQTAALQLNVTLGGAGVFTQSGIGNLVYHNTGDALDGKTVNQILAMADVALGTGTLPSLYTFGSLNTLITNLNKSFDNCTETAWAKTHLALQ